MIKTRINTSPDYLLELLDTLQLHTDDFADLMGVHRTTAFRWLGGRAAVPVSVIRVLEMTLAERQRKTEVAA